VLYSNHNQYLRKYIDIFNLLYVFFKSIPWRLSIAAAQPKALYMGLLLSLTQVDFILKVLKYTII